MDQTLVFAKTPIGDEAVRQSNRVVQRNLRMLLVQVDGKLSVAELSAKFGDPQMVEQALQALEEGGYIAPALEAVSVWQQSKLKLDQRRAARTPGALSIASEVVEESLAQSTSSKFSSFGKPVLPAEEESVEAKASLIKEHFRPTRRSYSALFLSGLIFLVVLAVATVLLFPYSRYKPDIEAELARVWRKPVAVGDVRLKFMPMPVLLLSDVRVANGESTIAAIRIFEPQALLGSGVPKLSRIEVSGARLDVEQLLALSQSGSGSVQAASLASLGAVRVDDLVIVAGRLTLGPFAGQLILASDGHLDSATLQTAEQSLRVSARATPEAALLEMEATAWRPREDSALTIDSLRAKGLLQKEKLIIAGFDATTLGGALRGSWLIDWSQGLAMAGDSTLARLDARKVAVHFAPPLRLEGEVSGVLRMRGAGADWMALWASLEATLDAQVMRGTLNGVDLGEASRRGPGAPVRAGTTKFDRLMVKITVDPRQVTGRDLALVAGPFSATGQFSVRDRQVDGSLVATVSGSAGVRTIPIKVSGPLPNLQAVAVR